MLVLKRKITQSILIFISDSLDPIRLTVTSIRDNNVGLSLDNNFDVSKYNLKVLEGMSILKNIHCLLVSVDRNQVKLAFDAPMRYKIFRAELKE